MASYTIELRNVCELYGREEVESWFKSYNLSDFLTPEQISQIEKYGVWTNFLWKALDNLEVIRAFLSKNKIISEHRKRNDDY